MKTIDKLKKRLLENPKIRMIAFNFPQGTSFTTTLSDILEERPDPKYFLSSEKTERILRLAEMSHGDRKSSVSPRGISDATEA